MIGGGTDEEGEMGESAKALADMLRQGAGRTMIVSQILTRKAIDLLTSIARGEPQEEVAPAAAAPNAASTETAASTEMAASAETEAEAIPAVSGAEIGEESQARTEE